ncbi:sperm-associated antigen 5 isoform X2 [Bufo gargarizans]|uniref:sperm-associated antigen 5 isoform X2 n=1 Tax=Bufo gargarizans TaxID=30331 RepID=UPI001CF132B6|nr:sperm-associated antigen 5 isoform X2 [Bufo gargarizans]
MWSSDNPASDENLTPAVQNVSRKSVGRTPLKVLSGQHLAVPNPNTQCKTCSQPPFTRKESARVGARTPVSVWTDPCHNDSLTESSQAEANTPLLESEVSEGDIPALPTGPGNCPQFSQSHGVAILSRPIDSFDSQPSTRNDSLLEDLQFTDEVEVMPEPGFVTSANDTYEMDPYLNASSELSSVTVMDVLSEVTESIENWNLSVQDFDDYILNESTDDEGNIKGCPLVEILYSSSLGTIMDDLKDAQLLSSPPERLGPVDGDHSERSLPDTEPDWDAFRTEVLFQDPEMSSCRTDHNYTSETHANKCCAPVDGVTTDQGDSTPLKHTKWFSPISKIDYVSTSNLDPDQGHVLENTPFTESCPTPIMPNPSMSPEILFLSKEICKIVTPRMIASSHEAETSMTPVSTTESVTWTTPIMLLNKSMNTSCDIIGKGERSAKDSASETDSVLWTFSREALRNASQEELMDRLEGTLIVVEVLSRQLQGWQQNQVSSKPSEQRECATQTCVTCTSREEEYYHDLYMKTLSRLESVQRSLEQEETLNQHLKVATDALTSHKNEASSMIEFAKSLYEITQKDRADLLQEMSHTRKLLADYTSILKKMSEKLKDSLLQQDEMKARLEDAMQAKEAADQCLQDLESHTSAVITKLRRDFESEKQLCQSVKDAYDQQHSYNEELAEFVHGAQYVCSEVEDDRTQLQRQVYSHLESIMSLHEQMKLENSRLGSELELLMDRLCALQSENEQIKEENSELEEMLSAKDSSIKLLEKELNEATARGRQHQDRIKYLTGEVVPGLEMDLSNALNEKQDLQKQLEMLAKEHLSQIAYYTESLEFLEQENSVYREQVSETESQLKIHFRTVLDRNLQCENLKDTVKELQKEGSDLKEKLSHTQAEAQTRIMKLNKEMSDSSTEVSKIKSRMLELVEDLRENTKTEAIESLLGSQTPGRNLVPCKDEELTTSVYAEGPPEEDLADVLRQLRSVFADLITTSSNAMEEKQQIIQDLRVEIASVKEELQSQRLRHTSETRVLQEELGSLKRRNCVLDEKLNSKEKCISELQEVVNQQEQKIFQQFSTAKESEVLIREIAELQMSLKVCENQVEVLKQELAQNSTEAARNWIQEKLLLHKDLTTLRLKLVDAESSKSEAIQRLLRHKDILKSNLALSGGRSAETGPHCCKNTTGSHFYTRSCN